MSAEDYVFEVQLSPDCRLDRLIDLIRTAQDTMTDMLGRELEVHHVQTVERAGQLILRVQWQPRKLP